MGQAGSGHSPLAQRRLGPLSCPSAEVLRWAALALSFLECAGGVPQPVPASSKALAAQERLRKLQQLQRLARPRRNGSSAGSSKRQALASAVSASANLACSQCPGGSLAATDTLPSASAEARSLEDILRRATALLAGPSAWDPMPDGPAMGHATTACANTGNKWPGAEDECVDTLIQRARRLLEQGTAEVSSACSGGGNRSGGTDGWGMGPQASWGNPVSAAADMGPTAEDDMLATFVARAELQGTADRAWQEGFGEGGRDAGAAYFVTAAKGASEQFGSTGACKWLPGSDRSSEQACDTMAVGPAAGAAGLSDAQAWQQWLAQEVGTW